MRKNRSRRANPNPLVISIPKARLPAPDLSTLDNQLQSSTLGTHGQFQLVLMKRAERLFSITIRYLATQCCTPDCLDSVDKVISLIESANIHIRAMLISAQMSGWYFFKSHSGKACIHAHNNYTNRNKDYCTYRLYSIHLSHDRCQQ